jgi:hypothetical protein
MLRRLVEGRLAFVYSSAQVPASHDLMDGSPTRTLFFFMIAATPQFRSHAAVLALFPASPRTC